MKDLHDSINKILSDWNPIEVPESIATIEYQSYVDEIIQTAETREHILRRLEDIVSNRMGLSYDQLNPVHAKEIADVADKIHSRVVESSAICMFCGKSLVVNSPKTAETNIFYRDGSSQHAFVHIGCLRSSTYKDFPINDGD